MKSNDSQVLDLIPVPIVVLKANLPLCTLIRFNDRYMKVVDKTFEELIGKNLFELYPDVNGNMKYLLPTIEKTITTKQSQIAPTLRYDINEKETYWSLEYVPLITDGVVTSLIQYTQDITALVKMGVPVQIK